MKKADIIILGGGPAGLSAAYYAQKNNLDFLLLEAGEETGGNCRTIWKGEFAYDTGAHRFHDKDKAVTEEIKNLLGEELKIVQSPSSIFYQNQFIDFPLSPLDLLKKLGLNKFLVSAWDIFRSNFFNGRTSHSDFNSFAIKTYGSFIAENFLINYSEKLWGDTADNLSVKISGKRLKGLDLKTFILEGFFGKHAKTRHLDGSFYYPVKGFGQIMNKMTEMLPSERVLTKAKVTSIEADGTMIRGVKINGEEMVMGNEFINTLSLPITLRYLNKITPEAVLKASENLRYRHLVLGIIYLNKNQFSPNASIYFPEKEVAFTRIYEPKNRSKQLAPKDKTCIVVEIPVQMEDEWWKMSDEEVNQKIEEVLLNLNLLHKEDIIGFDRLNIPYAYPILNLHFEENLTVVREYLQNFENLYLTGRSGLFTYSHLHDQMNWGKQIVEKIRTKTAFAG